MKQNHGPFYCVAGEHVQDDPTDITFAVKEVKDGHVFTTNGRKLEIVRGVYLLIDGRALSCWVGNRRMAPTNLTPGDEVVLCESRTYGAPSTPQNVRRDGVVYDAFRSHKDLVSDININKPNSVKIARATSQAQADEIAALRAQNAELIERLSRQNSVVGDDEAKRAAEEAARKQAENANDPNRKNPQQTTDPRGKPKQLQPA